MKRLLAEVGRVLEVKMEKETIKCVLVDLSGTLHIDDEEIPGSVKALERLRGSGVHLKFVTNTTKESKRVLHERLHKLGFAVGSEEIFTSLTAARKLLEEKQLRPLLLVDDKAVEDFEGVGVDDPNAVVVGLAPDKFGYNFMNEAFSLLQKGASLIAIHKARYYKRKDGLALGPGPFVAALEYATGQKAEVVGKPQGSFFHSAVREFSCAPQQCVMIGDDARDDVAGAQNCGMKGILVRTGKYRQGDESSITPPAFHVANDFPAAVDYILSSCSLE
ncbi:haloacid dehalogenase-like hydrolase domain-containing protein 2 [Babylonia areolata]|uniref:haloacid dehalogenase-like hydrolase domain-containing protein 2 n=1 Tax=Babylonia areolata TaxID=304850 RepID=UPI003FD05B67